MESLEIVERVVRLCVLASLCLSVGLSMCLVSVVSVCVGVSQCLCVGVSWVCMCELGGGLLLKIWWVGVVVRVYGYCLLGVRKNVSLRMGWDLVV